MTKPTADAQPVENVDEPAPLPTHVRYVGALDAVEVHLPSGRTVTVERDEVLEVLPIEAEALAAIPADWEPTTPPTSTEEK